MEPLEKTLVTKAVAGDAEALAELLTKHGPGVQQRLQIGRQWQSVLDADDVMQVTYLEAFLQISRFDPRRETTFATWLQHIAENNVRDALRGLKRQKRPQPGQRVHAAPGAGGGDSYVGLLEMIGVTSATPSRHVRREETHQMLDRAIGQLPEDYAAVIRGYDLLGRDIGDVAAEVGRSAGAVHMLRARAHDRLREILGSASMYLSAGG